MCYRYVGNNPVNAVILDGTIWRGGSRVTITVMLEGGRDYLEFLVGARVRNGVNGRFLQCAGQLKFLEVATIAEGNIGTFLGTCTPE